MLAPERIATWRCSETPECSSTHCLRPATERAPAGSITLRVSSNTSLIAAQIASFETRTTPSHARCAQSKVHAPTCRTATPSAKRPTCSRRTRSPAASERYIASASNGSTPITATCGISALT